MNTNRKVTWAVALLISVLLSEGLAKEKAGGGGAPDAHTKRGVELTQEKKFDEAVADPGHVVNP